MRANSRYCKAYKRCMLCQAGHGGIIHLWYFYPELRAQLEKEYGPMPIAKPVSPGQDQSAHSGARNGDEWVLYPNLLEFLTEGKYEDGSSRELATLLVFYEAGTWKGCLNDRDNDRNTFVSSGSLTGLLVVLEDKLKTSSVEWKPKGGRAQGKRR